jgi:hypothetical protein
MDRCPSNATDEALHLFSADRFLVLKFLDIVLRKRTELVSMIAIQRNMSSIPFPEVTILKPIGRGTFWSNRNESGYCMDLICRCQKSISLKAAIRSFCNPLMPFFPISTEHSPFCFLLNWVTISRQISMIHDIFVLRVID